MIMTQEQMREDIAWMKQLADEGRGAPLTGGSISIWWGLISFIMLLVHWGSVTEKLPIPIEAIGIGWILYAILGSIGTFFLKKRLKNAPGASAIGNQAASAAWMMVLVGIFTFWLGCGLAVYFAHVSWWIFNAILPVSFLCYGIAYGVTAKLAKNPASGFASAVSFALALALMPFLQSPTLYLIAAFAILVVTVVPTLMRGSKNG